MPEIENCSLFTYLHADNGRSPLFEGCIFVTEALKFGFQLFVGHGVFLVCFAIKPKSIAARSPLLPPENAASKTSGLPKEAICAAAECPVPGDGEEADIVIQGAAFALPEHLLSVHGARWHELCMG